MNSSSLDEPSQLLSIIFDISKSSWSSLIPHIPQQFQQYTDQILIELYNQTISQLCMYINAYLLLNKDNIIQIIALSDHSSSVIAPVPKLTYKSSVDGSAVTSSSSSTSTITPYASYSVDASSVVSHNSSKVESFGVVTAEIFAKLELLNPMLATLDPISSDGSSNITSSVTSSPSSSLGPGGITSPTSTGNVPSPTGIGGGGDKDTSRSSTLFAGALTKALCFINKSQIQNVGLSCRILCVSFPKQYTSLQFMNGVLLCQRFNCLIDAVCLFHIPPSTQVYLDQSLPEYMRQTQILSESVLARIPVGGRTANTGSATSPSTMNSNPQRQGQSPSQGVSEPFTVQPILPLASSTPCACEALQQATHLTHGQFLFISYRDMETTLHHIGVTVHNNQIVTSSSSSSSSTGGGLEMADDDTHQHRQQQQQQQQGAVIFPLLPLLLAHGLTAASIRQHLVTPQLTTVALCAPCYCHKTPQSIGYVCSVCLAVCCKELPQCPKCRTRFVVRRASQFPRSSHAPTAQSSNSQTSSIQQPSRQSISLHGGQSQLQSSTPSAAGAKQSRISISLGIGKK